jgi:flavin reductase (DIM6/NTAB) family NADH-FMN oxidoreductase RutF
VGIDFGIEVGQRQLCGVMSRYITGVSVVTTVTINVLGGSQAELAKRFAAPGLSNEDRFRWLELSRAITGSPLIVDSAAWLDCRVRNVFQVGIHGIFIGAVLAAGTDAAEEQPLASYQPWTVPPR